MAYTCDIFESNLTDDINLFESMSLPLLIYSSDAQPEPLDLCFEGMNKINCFESAESQAETMIQSSAAAELAVQTLSLADVTDQHLDLADTSQQALDFQAQESSFVGDALTMPYDKYGNVLHYQIKYPDPAELSQPSEGSYYYQSAVPNSQIIGPSQLCPFPSSYADNNFSTQDCQRLIVNPALSASNSSSFAGVQMMNPYQQPLAAPANFRIDPSLLNTPNQQLADLSLDNLDNLGFAGIQIPLPCQNPVALPNLNNRTIFPNQDCSNFILTAPNSFGRSMPDTLEHKVIFPAPSYRPVLTQHPPFYKNFSQDSLDPVPETSSEDNDPFLTIRPFNTEKFFGEKPKLIADKPWIRTNNLTQGKTSRTGKINHFNPSEHYTSLSHPTGPWKTRGGKKFEYNKWHELKRKEMPAHVLKEFISQHVKTKDCMLTLFIQRSAADSKRRNPTPSLDKCRLAECPARMHGPNKGMITIGHYRVALDEFSYRYGVGKGERIDPFLVAGYVHLYCLERFLDLPALCQLENVRVEADGRQLHKEPNGKFAAALIGSEYSIAASFVAAAQHNQIHSTFDWQNYPRHIEYRDQHDRRCVEVKNHYETLNYRMQRAKNEERSARVKEGDKPTNVAVHCGDLEVILKAKKGICRTAEDIPGWVEHNLRERIGVEKFVHCSGSGESHCSRSGQKRSFDGAGNESNDEYNPSGGRRKKVRGCGGQSGSGGEYGMPLYGMAGVGF